MFFSISLLITGNTLPTASFHRVFKTNLTRVSDTKKIAVGTTHYSELENQQQSPVSFVFFCL